MSLVHLPLAGYRRMPWKNGGGVTLEIASAPDDATIDTFAWRLSLARVAADGPFSRFPEIDRTLTVLSGEGIDLAVAGLGERRLLVDSPPFAFPGDVAAEATLIDGGIEDFNVMTRRGRATHRVARRLIAGRSRIESTAEVLFVLALAPVVIGAQTCERYDGVLDRRAGARGLDVRADEAVEVLVVQIGHSQTPP